MSGKPGRKVIVFEGKAKPPTCPNSHRVTISQEQLAALTALKADYKFARYKYKHASALIKAALLLNGTVEPGEFRAWIEGTGVFRAGKIKMKTRLWVA